jgi:hypothetical protein
MEERWTLMEQTSVVTLSVGCSFPSFSHRRACRAWRCGLAETARFSRVEIIHSTTLGRATLLLLTRFPTAGGLLFSSSFGPSVTNGTTSSGTAFQQVVQVSSISFSAASYSLGPPPRPEALTCFGVGSGTTSWAPTSSASRPATLAGRTDGGCASTSTTASAATPTPRRLTKTECSNLASAMINYRLASTSVRTELRALTHSLEKEPSSVVSAPLTVPLTSNDSETDALGPSQPSPTSPPSLRPLPALLTSLQPSTISLEALLG